MSTDTSSAEHVVGPESSGSDTEDADAYVSGDDSGGDENNERDVGADDIEVHVDVDAFYSQDPLSQPGDAGVGDVTHDCGINTTANGFHYMFSPNTANKTTVVKHGVDGLFLKTATEEVVALVRSLIGLTNRLQISDVTLGDLTHIVFSVSNMATLSSLAGCSFREMIDWCSVFISLIAVRVSPSALYAPAFASSAGPSINRMEKAQFLAILSNMSLTGGSTAAPSGFANTWSADHTSLHMTQLENAISSAPLSVLQRLTLLLGLDDHHLRLRGLGIRELGIMVKHNRTKVHPLCLLCICI
jgi:hypothetical protein